MVEYLHAVLDDVVENADDFKKSDEEAPVMFMGIPVSAEAKGEGAFRKYKINVLVDNSARDRRSCRQGEQPRTAESRGTRRAPGPVRRPAYRLQHDQARRPAQGERRLPCAGGARLLTKPYSWDALKRTLKTGEIRVEDVAQQMGFATTATLDPEPIPFKAKIVPDRGALHLLPALHSGP